MRKLYAAMFAAAVVVALPATSAQAQQPVQVPDGISAASMQPTTSSTTTTDPVCQKARAVTHEPGTCLAELDSGTGGAHVITAIELQRYGKLKAANGMTVARAAATSTVMINSWWQEQHGLYYVNWKERHEGAWLYNGSIAWVSDAHGYTGGYHYCNRGYGIGYSVDNQYCDSRNQNTSRVDNVDAYQVHVIAKGIPLYSSHSMTYRTYANGSSSAG